MLQKVAIEKDIILKAMERGTIVLTRNENIDKKL
jgi:hypothetical protein